MNISRVGLAVALLSAMYAFPCHAFAMDGPTGSAVFKEFSSCSGLTSIVDKDVCSYHLSAFKALIREKNSQVSPTTSSSVAYSSISPNSSLSTVPGTYSISETVRIRKISATTKRLGQEIFRTNYPTLFIFDAEQVPGTGQPATYELPLRGGGSSYGSVNSFQLPDNSAFVGNGTDILPEFVIEGGSRSHFVMSAPHNHSVYYLSNIEVDSRNPRKKAVGSKITPTGHPVTTPASKAHIPAGILDLKGAGIFVADNVKVVLDPADNQADIDPVILGCSNYADRKGTEESFIYRFTHTEFDLLKSLEGVTHFQNAALNVDCKEKTGHVELTMQNTKTVIFVPTKTLLPRPTDSNGVLFSLSLWPRENVLRLVDSTCNSVVDQRGNDLSVDLTNLLHPDHYMGGVRGVSYCSDIKIMQGAFGIKDREEAWGLIVVDHTDLHSCSTALDKRYQLGFAPVSAWSKAGFDVACNCTMPTSISFSSFPTYPYTTQVAYTSLRQIPGKGALAIDSNGTKRLTELEKAGIGIAAVTLDQAITHSWFYLSNRIKQTWIRHTSQILAATLGLGIPAIQLLLKCKSGLKKVDMEIGLLKDPAQQM
ncbi:hypothetical protein [Endozoicomonas sp. 8E]|uniref:hypothetical protein n=1 Tax=Endozoicomonas sp. 8E TaxID=3035692 RepID=UPI002938FA47|nr:hypothetical protein [Endozoicomonas sp. 8E]WOG29697.1 hypothetical protein P6910_08595 [Endozoicomonas sp. 8E]